jgi:hypothetical protein
MMKGFTAKYLLGLLLIGTLVGLLSVAAANAVDAAGNDTTRSYCGINVECAS